MDTKRVRIEGRGIVVRGNDIDTDRIIPARFLRTVTFEGLGDHAFEDDRIASTQSGAPHPFDQPRFAGARILLVNGNFGCGSSREHAPQALARWGAGIQAIVGVSFAEIFFGNCVALGIPCIRVSVTDIEALMQAVEGDPRLAVSVDVAKRTVGAGALTITAVIPDGPRQQFLEGIWDSTAELLTAKAEVLERASQLPYMRGYVQ